ncbi:neutral zinc metallopeptidase [Mycolicibacterium mageritense DSM 44476 = CIP 104973]|nr:neutral zinc metallopeptidase [Mycolicibacterium mageritense]MCC9182399.1 neutral zinc metallopeptidase [Mycolicibacterium mageritense]CDO23933.1 neutral zinc metallopeptidase [Mycolicibacterium mageritense DSM 44476 = CIP 104973]
MCCAVLLTACGTVVHGRATSMLFDPNRVGGLPVTDGNSGLRPNAPEPMRTAENSDGGDIDNMVLLAIDDIEEFWKENDSSLPKPFEPVETLVSYDSDDPNSPEVCGESTAGLVNAFFCLEDNLIGWDRGVLVPGASKFFGEMALVGVLAHEYGHAIQYNSGILDDSAPVIVAEQQADCFAGVYLRWVAAGHSKRFELSTGDGLSHVLAGLLYIRDQLKTERAAKARGNAHGSALDRISAFQIGFAGNVDQCAAIDLEDIKKRQGDLPKFLEYDSYGDTQPVDTELDEKTLQSLMDVLGKIYSPSDPPTLSTDAADCPDAKASPPASYCPATNTITVDLPALQVLAEAKNEDEQQELLQGDNTAISVLTSRYALAIQHEKGLTLDTPVAAMRTGCLTGVGQAKMAEPGGDLTLSPGDADEAISGLLTNGLAAADVNGTLLPAGFTRILAYRSGLQGDAEQCYQRFP